MPSREGVTHQEIYGCPNHPNAGTGYHPITGECCVECGHGITLLKGVWTATQH
jgi:hypothetical protein